MSAFNSMTVALTATYDTERAVYGPDGNLLLKQFDDTMQPVTVLAEVSGGWGFNDKEETVVVTVVEGAPLAGGGTITESEVNSAAVLGVGGRDYLIVPRAEGGITPPVATPRLWLIKAKLMGLDK